eukprot:1136224-Amphidinium_carterae.1
MFSHSVCHQKGNAEANKLAKRAANTHVYQSGQNLHHFKQLFMYVPWLVQFVAAHNVLIEQAQRRRPREAGTHRMV